MVFGDDVNDIGMFRLCGHAVAMGNAIDELKAIADEIADTNDCDGVAKVLERMLAEKEGNADAARNGKSFARNVVQ